jgi:hypothetical protein
VQVSPLRIRLQRLFAQFPSETAECLEDWLVDVANARGARIVSRDIGNQTFASPPLELLTNEELVAGICQLQALDRPQMLRLAGQLISRHAVRLRELRLLAERERIEPVLGELARQALRVNPDHPLWGALAESFPLRAKLRSPILHWTRLATPIMDRGRCNAAAWKLVA